MLTDFLSSHSSEEKIVEITVETKEENLNKLLKKEGELGETDRQLVLAKKFKLDHHETLQRKKRIVILITI